MLATVVLCVAAHDDLGSFFVDGGVAHALQMLIGDGAVVVRDFLKPFCTHKNESIGAEDGVTIVLEWLMIHLENRTAIVELVDESSSFHVVAVQRHTEAIVGCHRLVEIAVSDDSHVGVLDNDTSAVVRNDGTCVITVLDVKGSVGMGFPDDAAHIGFNTAGIGRQGVVGIAVHYGQGVDSKHTTHNAACADTLWLIPMVTVAI